MSSNEAAATESPTRPTIRDAVMSPKNTSIIPPYLWESSSFHIKTTESGNIAATAVDSTVSTVTINIDSTKLPSVRPCMSHERPFNRITGVICQAIRDLSGLGIEAAPVRSGLTLRLGNRGISIDSGLFFTYRGVPVAGYNPHQARCINTRIPYYQTGQGIAGSADGVNWAIIIAIAQPQRKAIVSKDMVPNYPLNVCIFNRGTVFIRCMLTGVGHDIFGVRGCNRTTCVYCKGGGILPQGPQNSQVPVAHELQITHTTCDTTVENLVHVLRLIVSCTSNMDIPKVVIQLWWLTRNRR